MKVKDLIECYRPGFLQHSLTIEISKNNDFYKLIQIKETEPLLKDEVAEKEIVSWFIYGERHIAIDIKESEEENE